MREQRVNQQLLIVNTALNCPHTAQQTGQRRVVEADDACDSTSQYWEKTARLERMTSITNRIYKSAFCRRGLSATGAHLKFAFYECDEAGSAKSVHLRILQI